MVRGVTSRILKTVSDVTVGTVIVLFHVALAERESIDAVKARRIAGRDVSRSAAPPL
jgi:hypothetical protein